METKKRSRDEILKHLPQIDPIGQIRLVAEELWKEAGSPKNSDWLDYFSEAEVMMLSGRGSGSEVSKKKVVQGQPEQIDPKLNSLRLQSSDPLLSILASIFERFLNEHDALCLANILRSNRIKLRSGHTYETGDISSVSKLLASLAEEYSEAFLKKAGVSRAIEAPFEQRVQYWNEKLTAVEKADAPLTYADRDAVLRIRGLIEGENRVANLEFVP